jgi:hypothetical protein
MVPKWPGKTEGRRCVISGSTITSVSLTLLFSAVSKKSYEARFDGAAAVKQKGPDDSKVRFSSRRGAYIDLFS